MEKIILLPSLTIQYTDYDDEVKAQIYKEAIERKLNEPSFTFRLREIVKEAGERVLEDIPKAFWDLPKAKD